MINENFKYRAFLYKNGFVLFFVIAVCSICLINSYKAINYEYSKIVLISESEIQNPNYPKENMNDMRTDIDNAFMNAVEVNSVYTDGICELELV